MICKIRGKKCILDTVYSIASVLELQIFLVLNLILDVGSASYHMHKRVSL
jgi:hypothetical protein